MSTPSESAPYPTTHVAQLVPTMQQEVALLRRIVAASPTASALSSDPCNHTALLDLAEALMEVLDPAAKLFFAYPSQRLSQALLLRADELMQAITWLSHSPLADGPAAGINEYSACCERLQSVIREWRLAIHLETTARDLDEQQPETLH